MKSYKVYKTLQRSPRLFAMDRSIGIEFACFQIISIVMCFVVIGTNGFAVIAAFLSIPLNFFLFRIRDRKNAQANFKKKRINKKKPKVIKQNPLILLPSESIINKK
ncbi:MAG: hypothetical protein AAF348_10945 [Bacteroidota bacterium]